MFDYAKIGDVISVIDIRDFSMTLMTPVEMEKRKQWMHAYSHEHFTNSKKYRQERSRKSCIQD
ncbi:MAG: hypothetical protein EBU27_05480 [Opitutae bacterium]|nr:hypothetical protein [Opitutae bacterium]